jgi:hypothetical protein
MCLTEDEELDDILRRARLDDEQSTPNDRDTPSDEVILKVT